MAKSHIFGFPNYKLGRLSRKRAIYYSLGQNGRPEMRKARGSAVVAVALGLLAGENANRDKKDLFLQRGDHRRADRDLQRPTAGPTLPQAEVTGQAASAGFPYLIWNTFLGSSAIDSGNAIAVDKNGNIYIAGTSSADWGDPRRPFSGGTDAFVAKLDANGRLLWNTFLGGGAQDQGNGIAVNSDGSARISGTSDWRFLGQPAAAVRRRSGRLCGRDRCQRQSILEHIPGGEWMRCGDASPSDENGNSCITGSSTAGWGTPLRPFPQGVPGNYAFAARLDAGGKLMWNTFFAIYDGSGIGIDAQPFNGTYGLRRQCSDRGFWSRTYILAPRCGGRMARPPFSDGALPGRN